MEGTLGYKKPVGEGERDGMAGWAAGEEGRGSVGEVEMTSIPWSAVQNSVAVAAAVQNTAAAPVVQIDAAAAGMAA